MSELTIVADLNDESVVQLSLTSDEVRKVITEAVNLDGAIDILTIVFTETNQAAITYGKNAFFSILAKYIEADVNARLDTLVADRRSDDQIEAELFRLEMDAIDAHNDSSQDP